MDAALIVCACFCVHVRTYVWRLEINIRYFLSGAIHLVLVLFGYLTGCWFLLLFIFFCFVLKWGLLLGLGLTN